MGMRRMMGGMGIRMCGVDNRVLFCWHDSGWDLSLPGWMASVLLKDLGINICFVLNYLSTWSIFLCWK